MPSIVLAEPSAPVAGVLRRYLESAGHAVSWVGSVDEALRTLREQSPAILLASGMGALDGEALCRTVRAEGMAAPVLLLYSPDEEQADTRAAEVGADGCLVGPLKRATVLTCVSLLVQREEARRRVATLSGVPLALPVRPQLGAAAEGLPLPGGMGMRPPPPPPDDDAGAVGAMHPPPPPPLDDDAEAAGARAPVDSSTPGDAADAHAAALLSAEGAALVVTRASVVSPHSDAGHAPDASQLSGAGGDASVPSSLSDGGTALSEARAASSPPPLPGASVALAPELDAEPITSPSSEVDSDAREAVMVPAQATHEPDAAEDDGLPLLHAEPEPDVPPVAVGVIVEGEGAEPSSAVSVAQRTEPQAAGAAQPVEASPAAVNGRDASVEATGADGATPESLPAQPDPVSAAMPADAAPVGPSEAPASQSPVRGPDAGAAGSTQAPAPVAGSRMSGAFPALASTPVPDGRRISRSDLASVGSNPDFEFLKRLMLMEVKRSRRYRYPIAVLLVDLDRFTEKAASLAPAARKLALAEALGLLVSGVRDIDVAVPFADSRFVVFLPHTPRSGALVVGQRLRELIKSLKAFDGASASVGVAVSEPPPGRGPVAGALAQVSFGSLLKEAGEALRRAQAAGGDWVEAASGRTQPG